MTQTPKKSTGPNANDATRDTKDTATKRSRTQKPPSSGKKGGGNGVPSHGRPVFLIICLALAMVFFLLLFFTREIQGLRIISELGLAGSVYYIILCILGLAVAGFLFGILPSSGEYAGGFQGGKLKLGGAVVGFFIVVAGGYPFAPAEQFAAVVYVHGAKGRQDAVLQGKGCVQLDVGHRREEPIDAKGQARFNGLPGSFRGKDVVVTLSGADFEPANETVALKKETYLQVRPKPCVVSGFVRDGNGSPIRGAQVRIEGLSALTGEDGRFSVALPDDMAIKAEIPMTVTANGFRTWMSSLIPRGGSPSITMQSEN